LQKCVRQAPFCNTFEIGGYRARTSPLGSVAPLRATTRTPPPDERVGRGTKAFVVGFLVVFAACGWRGYELWPFTGWRLFSGVRTAKQVSWHATAVDRDGDETPIPFGVLPRGYHGSVGVLRTLPRLPASQRRQMCAAWADVLRRRGHDVTAIRVYRNEQRLPLHRSRPLVLERQELRHTCRLGGDGA
jgi:hypothetical protein